MDTRYPIPWLERRLGAAVIASLAVHAAAMSISFPAPRVLLSEARPVLEVSLRELVVPAVVAPEPARARTGDCAAEARQAGAAGPRARAHRPDERAAGAKARGDHRGAARSDTRARSRRRRVGCAAVAAPRHSESRRCASPSSQLLSGYGLAIAEVLARYKEYPPIAQMQGWEGSVTMQLRVAASGRLLEAEVHRSSGHGVLDREALAMAAKAARFPPPPEGLGDHEVEVLVPIVFRLER